MRLYNYHVFTPFSRFQNLVHVAKRLYAHGVQWHPIFDADLPFTLQADWIHPMVCPTKEPGWFVGHWYQNWFVEHAEIVDGDRYIMCSDDDVHEEPFFDIMDLHEGKALVCSMQRHSDRLIAAPENMQGGRVGGEQLMVSGEVLRQFRWTAHNAGDWDWIASVIAKYPPAFVPEATVWWNHLDTGKPVDFVPQKLP